MPLYEYICQSCNKEHELLVHGSQEPLCPECGSGRLTKLLSIVAAPGRENASGPASASRPGGSCGSHCGCHPHG